jgi:hypothetical protein
MAILNCKEPGCTGQVDTTLACKKVNALFGLKLMVETDFANKKIIGNSEILNQLIYIDNELKDLGIEDPNKDFESYMKFKMQDTESVTPPVVRRQLYIECTKKHRNYYETDCND